MRSLDQAFHAVPRAEALPAFILDRARHVDAERRDREGGLGSLEQARIKERVVHALGIDNIPRTPGVRMLDSDRFDGFAIHKLVFEAVPGLPVPAHLYLPDTSVPHPAVVHPPGHWMEDAKLAHPIQLMNIRLVRAGIAVLCYDTLGQGERRVGWHQHGQLAPLLAGFTSLGLMVTDTLASLDILEGRDDIDSSRLGVVGASGGAFSSIFAAVLDERISAAAISSIVNTHVGQMRDSAFGTGWDSWVDLCNQVPGLCEVGSMGEILACIAPRAVLVANATEDRLVPSEGAREVAADVRALLSRTDDAAAFDYSEVPGGHGFGSQEMREVVARFVAHRLGVEVGAEAAEQESAVEPCYESPWPMPHNLASARSPQEFTARASKGTCLESPVDSNAPVVALARERAILLRERRNDLTLEQLQAALGPFPLDGPTSAPRVSRHLVLDGISAQRVELESELGMPLDAVLILPDNFSDDLAPVLVALDEGGKCQALTSPDVQQAMERGWAVLLPDLRGTGESDASEFELASAAWMLDRDLLNQRVWDVRRFIDFLSDRYSSAQQIDKGRIVLAGAGSFSLVALLAAALDDRIHGVISRGIRTLEELLQVNAPQTPMLFHYRLLEVMDIPDLVRLIEPRTVRLLREGEAAADLFEGFETRRREG